VAVDTVALEPGSAAIRLAEVIGKNAHRLRKAAELTLDQVSIATRKRGLNWSESRVADFESGRVAPNLATLVAFCLALADAGCAEVAFSELLRSETPIQINDSLLLSSELVVNLLTRGQASTAPPSRMRMPGITTSVRYLKETGALAELTEPSGATEERTWKALGISETELAELSATLWSKSFSEERDRRAGPGASPQKRGQVSRELRKELQGAIEATPDGDDK
jgi:transcriptional regulator with XRE-family HTH domain